MSRARRAYPEYRDSGLPWLGAIPAHWEVQRAKRYLREVDERSQDGSEERLSVSHLTGVTPRREKNITMFEAESYIGHKVCRPRDVVVNTMWAWMGALGVARHHGIVSPAYGVYRLCDPGAFIPAYLEYLLRTPALVAEYVRRSTGIQESRLRLYSEKLLDIALVRPPVKEQQQIVDYLDAQVRLVRRFEQAKRQVVRLLTDQARAVVEHHLLSAPPTPLRRVAEVRLSGVDKHTREGEPLVRLCNYVDVYRRDQIDDSVPFMAATATAEEIARFAIRRSDVIVTKDSESWTDIGVPALVTVDLPDVVCAYHLALIRPDPAQLDGEYLFRVFNTPAVRHQLHRRATGVTRFGLSQHTIKSVAVPLPPLDVQRAVCAAIRAALAPLDEARARIARELTLILEYRARVVSDVVTGRFDVRGAVAHAPRELNSGDGENGNAPDLDDEPADDADEALELDAVTSDAD